MSKQHCRIDIGLCRKNRSTCSLRHGVDGALVEITKTIQSCGFGTIVVNDFLIRPECMQSGFKCVSSFCMHNVIRQTVPHIDNSISKKLRTVIG